MEKKIRTHMTIPIFYHEDAEGRIILDNEYMREYFENQLKKVYLETKLGKKEFWKKQLNKIK
tara:strand:+ start:1263 stop:1448 length:186 start_codon:yes stop_codon:yes gene_type:complete